MLTEKPWKIDAVGRLFLGVMATLWVGSVILGSLGSSTFSAEDIKDAPGLVRQWSQPTSRFSSFLWQKLSPSEQQELRDYQVPGSTTNQAQALVVQSLNKIVAGPSIYERQRFRGVSLRSETLNLIEEKPTGHSLEHLNRLLLEDAYPTELSKNQDAFWQLVASASFLEIPALVWITFFLRSHRVSWTEAFGFRASEPVTAVAYGILAGALFVPVGWCLEKFSGDLMDLVHLTVQDQQVVQELQDPSLTLPMKIIMGVIAVLLAPLVEELLFRGLLYPAIKQWGHPRLALWGSSALFALVHFNVESFAPLMIFALVLVYLYETFQNLLAPMVAHSLFNAANFLVLIFQDKIDHWLRSA